MLCLHVYLLLLFGIADVQGVSAGSNWEEFLFWIEELLFEHLVTIYSYYKLFVFTLSPTIIHS